MAVIRMELSVPGLTQEEDGETADRLKEEQGRFEIHRQMPNM